MRHKETHPTPTFPRCSVTDHLADHLGRLDKHFRQLLVSAGKDRDNPFLRSRSVPHHIFSSSTELGNLSTCIAPTDGPRLKSP